MHVCIFYDLRDLKKALDCLEPGLTGGCELPSGCWKLNLSLQVPGHLCHFSIGTSQVVSADLPSRTQGPSTPFKCVADLPPVGSSGSTACLLAGMCALVFTFDAYLLLHLLNSFIFNYSYFVYGCFPFMYVCAPCRCSAPGGQKRTSAESQGLKL